MMIGDRYFGLRGALAALAGMLAVSRCMLVLALALVYAHSSSHPAVAGALRGMGAVAAGPDCGHGLQAVWRRCAITRWAPCAPRWPALTFAAWRCCAGRWPGCCPRLGGVACAADLAKACAMTTPLHCSRRTG
jgi:chromate transporter